MIPMKRRPPSTLIKVISVSAAAALLACSDAIAASPVPEAPASLTLYRCYICHADREVGVGPAFADVAAYYRGRRGAVSKIAAEIRRGIRGGGPWHMPPHPEVSLAEAREMAHYIMSLPKENVAPIEVDGR